MTDDALDLSVVLPAHNEIGLLGSTVTNLVTGLEARGLRFEVLIVENGSTDGTLRLARMLAAQIDRVKVLSLERSDYGAALLSGFEAALAPYVANFDVDYYDFGFLDEALAAMAKEDGPAIVLASKRAPGAVDRRPVLRRAMTLGFTLLLRALVGLSTTDAHGMKVLDRNVLGRIVSMCRLRGSLFDVEMVVRAHREGLDVLEVPATVSERRPPRSSPWRRVIESTVGALQLRRTLGGATSHLDVRRFVLPKDPHVSSLVRLQVIERAKRRLDERLRRP